MFWTTRCETAAELEAPLLGHTDRVASSAEFVDLCTCPALLDPAARLEQLHQQDILLNKRQERLFAQHLEDIGNGLMHSKAALQTKAEYDSVRKLLKQVWDDIVNEHDRLRQASAAPAPFTLRSESSCAASKYAGYPMLLLCRNSDHV